MTPRINTADYYANKETAMFRMCMQSDPDVSRFSVHSLDDSELGMSALRGIFPDGKANALNLCFFSTSGVNGSYLTIEDAEAMLASGEETDVTFLVVCPRVVSLRCGNCIPRTEADFAFLKSLRASTIEACKTIGFRHEAPA